MGQGRFHSFVRLIAATGRYVRPAVIGVLAFAGALIPARAAPFMALDGQWNVTSTGAFIYSIPLRLPPGTHHLAPHLALTYSSQGGDGYLGLGWSLSGLSAITRCPATIAQDGVAGGVTYRGGPGGYGTSDRLCLDGKRLILTTANGHYGGAGTTYQPEVTDYSSITANGQTGNGPNSFDVYGRDGTHYEYGTTSDSQVTVGSSDGTIRVWALDRITDTKGNYITFTYNYGNQYSQEYFVTSIGYTGKTNVQQPPNSISFEYEARTEKIPTYQAGYEILMTQRLKAIHTSVSNVAVLNYNLGYNNAHAGNSTPSHDELASIQLCSPANCLKTTAFGWQGSGDSPQRSKQAINLGTTYSGVAPGDFNGDGITDVFVGKSHNDQDCGGSGPIFFGRQDESGYDAAAMAASYYELDQSGDQLPETDICFPYSDSVPTDINDDGITDISVHIDVYHPQRPGSDFLINDGISNGNISFQQVGNTGQVNYPAVMTYNGFPSDFNNDGYPDAVAYDENNSGPFVYLLQGNGNFQKGQPVAYLGDDGDFDGDGCTDILWQVGNSSGVAYSPYCGAPSTGSAPVFNQSPHVYGDFNGDGKTDVVIANTSGVCLYLSTGTGFPSAPTYCIPQSTSWYNEYTMEALDFNGDGKADLVLLCQSQCSQNLVLASIYGSNGSAFEPLDNMTWGTGTVGVVADWNSDGAADLWLQSGSTANELLFAYTPELMTSISNGLGVSTSVNYDRINNSGNGFYQNQRNDAYPTQDESAPVYVPKTITTTDGSTTTLNWSYTYNTLAKDLWGRGNLGFQSIAVTDPTGNVRTTSYRTDFPFIGQVKSDIYSATVNSATVVVSDIENTWNSTSIAGVYFAYLQKIVSKGNDLDGSTLPEVDTTYSYTDGFGNVTSKQVSIPQASPTFTSTTTNTFQQNQSPWIVNELLSSTTENKLGSSSDIVRPNSYTPDAATGLITGAQIQTDDPNLELDIAIGYDGFGNPKIVTESSKPGAAQPIVSRTTKADWGTTGQFLTTVTNAKNQQSQLTFEPSFGTQTSLTDPNPITESWAPDDFGRPSTSTAPTGATTTVIYNYCQNDSCNPTQAGPVTAVYWQKTSLTANGVKIAPVTYEYFDAFSRQVATDMEGFDGTWMRVTRSYDTLGRLSTVSQPYSMSGGSPALTTYQGYDKLNRVGSVIYPTDSGTGTTTYGYSGLVTTVKDDNNRTTTTTRNAEGLVADVLDANGTHTTYTYDAFGDPVKVVTPGGNIVKNWFDERGRKIQSSDPDMGQWNYTFDVLGELTQQVDAKGQTATLTYDLLGRLVERDEADMTSTWQYDTAQYGIGQLAQASCTATSGSSYPDACPSNGYTRSYIYDSFGRQTSEQVSLSIGLSPYYSTETYDPTTTQLTRVRAFSGFTVNYNYNNRGYLCEITDYSTGGTQCNDSYGQFYWQANSMDAFMHITEETTGNDIVTDRTYGLATGDLQTVTAGPQYSVFDANYTWGNIGNLITRTDLLQNYAENFCYDTLYRLNAYSVAAGCHDGSNKKTVQYDTNTPGDGDISSKSDIGTYNYTGANGGGPHAVTSINTHGSYVYGVTNPSFFYDANGNMTCVTTHVACGANAARRYTWTSFNMIENILQGTTFGTFTYTPEHERVTQVTSTGTVSYFNDPVGGIMAERFAGSTTTWRTYLAAYGHIVAERITQGSSANMLYFVGDHLGSTVALTSTVNNDGPYNIQEEDSYDAWGRRRNVDGSDHSTCTITSATLRGYTGQEMMDSFCLVNLNARLYDPVIGRFLSPDSMVPNPLNGQSYNRYSYVENNPLSHTDPSGHAENDNPPYNIRCISECWTGSRLAPDGSNPVYGAEGMMFLSAIGFSGFGGYATGGGFGGYGSLTGHIVHTGPGTTQDLTGTPETVVIDCQCYWQDDSFWYGTSDFLQWNGEPANESNSLYNFAGLKRAFDRAGWMLGGQIVGTSYFMHYAATDSAAGDAAAASVEEALRPAGYAVVALTEAAQIGADVQAGTDPTTAITGAAVNGAIIIGVAGSATTLGGPAIGALAGGVTAELLPSNAVMGTWALEAGYWAGPGLYGPGN